MLKYENKIKNYEIKMKCETTKQIKFLKINYKKYLQNN